MPKTCRISDSRGRYLIVGGHALAFHAKPRATKDLDVFLQRTPANARRVLKALSHFFGGADLGYDVKDLLNPRLILQLGVVLDLRGRLEESSDRQIWPRHRLLPWPR